MPLRLLCPLAIFSLAGLLVACQGNSQPNRKLIVIIVPSLDNPFFKAEAEAAASRATQLGYRTRVDSHDDDAYKQDNLIDMAIASNAAALILDNAGAEASIAAVRRAARAGIACFLIDREIGANGIARAQIIADNDQGARLVAGEFARAMSNQGAYAELLGKESDTNAQVRTKGFHAVLDNLPDLRLIARQSANWSQAEAFQKTETMLQAHANIGGIIAGNDTMALGAAAAVKSSGLRRIAIVGFDGNPDALLAIRQGSLQATVLQPAVKIARQAVDEADLFLRSGSTAKPERQIVPCELVNRDDVHQFGVFERSNP